MCNNFFTDKIVWSQRKSSSKESVDHSHQLTAISNVIQGNYTSFILMFDKSTDLLLTEPNFNFSVWSQQELNIGGVMLNPTKPQMYITEKIRIVHVFLPKVKQHAELKNGFADFIRHI